MRGLFASYDNTDLVLSLSPSVKVLDEIIIDPSYVPSHLRFGGILTGSGNATLYLYKGGTHNNSLITDGSLIFTSSALTAPMSAFTLDLGLHGISSMTRLKLGYTSSSGGVGLKSLFYFFY